MALNAGPQEVLESKTDVLIIGAGPAGLMAAWWMARCDINVRIIDKRGTKVINGHADGLRARTEEILDSMGHGLQEKVTREGYIFESLKTWIPDEKGGIFRNSVDKLMQDHINDLPSPFLNVTITQGRIERFLVDAIGELSHWKLDVERGVTADSLVYDPNLESDHGAYPITVTLRTLSDDEANPKPANGAFGGRDVLAKSNLPPDEWNHGDGRRQKSGTLEVLKARYLIGSDGAHSWLRDQLDYRTEGSRTDSIWGVMDIVPITDFPDIRYPCFIKGTQGTLMLVPRERNMTRVYVPFSEQSSGDRFNRASITLEQIVSKAKKFFAPYKLDFTVCEWWSVYQVSQRVAERSQHPGNRIFLTGDAVHMHSPKVGLGMNTSIQDGFNLGWKVALAVAGIVRDENALLATYEGERLPVAQKLVAFDRTLFIDNGNLDPKEFQKRHTEFREFSDGRKLMYAQSILVSKQTSTQSVATGLIVGESFKHARVLGHANSQLYWTTKLFESDSRFRIVLMAGDVSVPHQMERVKRFCERLEAENEDESGRKTSLLYTRYRYPFTVSSDTQDVCSPILQHPAISYLHQRCLTSMVSLLAIHSTVDASESISPFEFPAALRGPFDPSYHGWDFSRIFVDAPVHYDRYCDGRAYTRWGIDRTRGAVVVVRPDMHVGWVGELEDHALEAFFANLLK
ncbi:Phenol 2-monooxygenase [Penicillium antarcticum]|uniref:Phenol 2-monooxygenase n=1 Tax=Penicillium antarcticum TaxID=416450 RepID=UPI002382B67F|nr:Phenol 2-monooxygenase [Penicillium antarcticum]KAJ5301913.1 Phenol 2-monooxygenase [Penicillium antarcticum]